MTVVYWFSVFFVLFSVLYYWIGLTVGKNTLTENDYFLAGRTIGLVPLAGTLLATQIGSGLTLGTADAAYRYGFAGLFYGFGCAAGFVVLGLGVAGALRSLNVGTTAEVFEKYFASPALKRIASLLSILSLTGIFIAQVVASRHLLSVGVGLENDWLFICFWVVLIAYTMYGGLPGVVATDLLQMTVIVSVFVGFISWCWWQGLISGEAVRGLGVVHAMPVRGFADWFGYLGMPLLFSLVEQDLAQRFFSAQSSKIASRAAWASAVGIVSFATIPAVIGVQARLSGLAVVSGQSPFIAFVSQHLGPLGQALIMCALVAAVASTADSLLCAISSNVVQDFVSPAYGSVMRMRSAELVTGIVGVVSLVSSYYCTNVLTVLIQSYELLVSGILVPVLMCVMRAPLGRLAAMWSVTIGLGVYAGLWFGFVSIAAPYSLVALGCSLVAYGAGIMVSRISNC
jgi:SSS family solute:Na+ symporter